MALGDTTDNPMIDELRAAVIAKPESPVAHMRLGTALLRLGEIKEAEAALRRAVELDPGYAEAWVNLGGLLLGRWDFAGCIEVNTRAAEIRPDLLQAHYNRGLGHLYLGQAEEMVTTFRRVLETDPNHPGGNYHLAVGLLAVGQSAAARMSLSKATELGFSPQPEFLKALEREEQGKQSGGGHVTTIEIGQRRSEDSRDSQGGRDA